MLKGFLQQNLKCPIQVKNLHVLATHPTSTVQYAANVYGLHISHQFNVHIDKLVMLQMRSTRFVLSRDRHRRDV